MFDEDTNKPLSYKGAGVSIDAGNQLVTRIKTIAQQTKRPEVLHSIGGFSALYELPMQRYRNPILVSSTDGVGTKLLLAIEAGQLNKVGIDLVAMCVNDIIVCGAEPLFFLDYYACSKLEVAQAEKVIEGIAEGCKQAGIALIGGETAEMPGMYTNSDFDLAGFCLGIVEKRNLIDCKSVTTNQVLVGIASSGPHSNGFSLIRKILQKEQCNLEQKVGKTTLSESLLAPTRIYVKSILELTRQVQINAIAHITGGGLIDNLARVIPNRMKAVIIANYWQIPEIFLWLRDKGQINWQEMYRTFNCGIGMVVCVSKKDLDKTLDILEQSGERAWPIGVIESRKEHEPQVIFS